jgi:hypothetical protein
MGIQKTLKQLTKLFGFYFKDKPKVSEIQAINKRINDRLMELGIEGEPISMTSNQAEKFIKGLIARTKQHLPIISEPKEVKIEWCREKKDN